MVKLILPSKNVAVDVFTSYDEVTPEYLEKSLNHIKLSDYQAIVALCAKVSLYELTLYSVKRKDAPIGICTLLGKVGNCGDKFKFEGKVGDNVTLTRSALEMGVSVKNVTLSDFNALQNFVKSDIDEIKKLFQTDEFKQNGKIIDGVFVAYKIVNVSDIKATYNVNDITNEVLTLHVNTI